MTDGPPRRIAFLGFGLIAGSVARALAAGGAAVERPTLIAWSPSNTGPEAAVREGVIDATADDPTEALEAADLIVIGAPPLETIELVRQLGGSWRPSLDPGAVVTDLASTKAQVVAAADAADLPFVGGHPMAGRESAGYASSTPELFAGRPWVIVPGRSAGAEAEARVTWLATACGARPVRMDAPTHDAAAAAISHLPLVIAATLVEAVAGGDREQPGWVAAVPLAASGWRDMTRLARGDVRMGAGIAATNPGPLLDGLREMRAAIDGWIGELERDGGPDAGRLEARLRAARDRLERSAGDGA